MCNLSIPQKTKGMVMNSHAYPHLLTVNDLSVLLNKSPKAIYELVHRRRIPYLKIGASLRFDRARIEEWLEANSVEPLEKEARR